ncbi:UTP--glucose-1-phosphate uridylyltransferase [bacterium I07]|nr:UTP--glucose-1-phosphate uridylyltransferase [bacterium I07]
MSCPKLILQSGRNVRKALIPAAGFGTRLFPASKAIKKELFPVIDQSGRAKPVIMAIVEEAVQAGIEEVGIIVQEADLPLFQNFFSTPPRIENFNKLSAEDKEYSQYIIELGHRVTFLPQEAQEGFGHAVYCARDWIKDEPFLLMLGDHIYASDTETSCARQLLELYEKTGRSVVGLKVTPGDEIGKFGCVTGSWKEPAAVLNVSEFAEKPKIEYARQHLHVEGMEPENFLTVFGQYILSPKIFDFLEEHINNNVRERGEFQLTSCLDRLRQADGFTGYVVNGRRFDIGVPEAYRQTIIDFRNA